MKITMYELLGLVKDGKVPKKIKYNDYIYTAKGNAIESFVDYCREEDDFCFNHYVTYENLNDTIEIIEEEKELYANKIVFNCDNSKRECVINLDENDLGIDKLHIDNCYFYKENDKWYVRKYDFKNFNLEEKKIPEKIKTKIGYGGLTYLGDEDFSNGTNGFNHREDVIVNKINEIIDYLKSKGDE